MNKTFSPIDANTAQLAASVASSRVAIDTNSPVVRVLNAGPNIAFLNFGDATVTSTVARIPLPVGNTELFCKAMASHAAAICDSGTAVLYFTSGEGM